MFFSCCCCEITSVVSDSVRPHRRQPTRLPHPWDSPGKNTGVGCHFLLQYMKVKSENEVVQSCPTLRDPMDGSRPGSSFHGIFQARVLEWVAIAFSVLLIPIHYCNVLTTYSQYGLLLLLLNHFSRVRLFATLWTIAYQASLSMGFPKQEYWSGLPASTKGFSPPRDRTQVSCISCIGRGVLYH